MATSYADQQLSWKSPELRSVTPATNNTRQTGRYASAPRVGRSGGLPGGVNDMNGNRDSGEPYVTQRSMTPSNGRYLSNSYSRKDDTEGPPRADPESRTPSSTGLIRLSLRKPMGIVFEPMYDPNNNAHQRGVRICDLPRTGAAALSRKLQVGDELLQINETTVSRKNFDDIMEFIINADPESVNLLFRRPRKETLQARQGVQQKLNAAANKDNPSTVKWVDEERGGNDKKKSKERNNKSDKRKESKRSRRSKKDVVSEEEEETVQSSMGDTASYVKRRSRKKGKSKKDPYGSESFLDILIDTICSNSNNVCRDTFRRGDEEYYSDDESFVSEGEDESTYVTYEESVEKFPKQNRKKESKYTDTDEDDTIEDKYRKHKKRHKEQIENRDSNQKPYVDDGTLETEGSIDKIKQEAEPPVPQPQAPLGLEPPPQPELPQQPVLPVVLQNEVDEGGNPLPIKEVEYDDRIDHGADVSVMESLGGPSLLIEKQRAAAAQKSSGHAVPPEIMDEFGLDYPADFGMTREETIDANPLRFYSFVVKHLLEEHEPEKVRLLDKLLAKYKGREDHLVQKLFVRYTRSPEDPTSPIHDDHDEAAFTDAVKKSKASSNAAAAVNTARERLQRDSPREQRLEEEPTNQHDWPEKEEKEPDTGDEDESESGSEYSEDSVDGTSPAVIAQVSELLNYVYGKTSVPGQIDRVSTIMRAYEGREAVLLELLETKALIKANKEKESAENLPSFLRNSQMVQAQNNAEEIDEQGSPIGSQPPSGTDINDDISSMSGVSSPVTDPPPGALNQTVSKINAVNDIESNPCQNLTFPFIKKQFLSITERGGRSFTLFAKRRKGAYSCDNIIQSIR